MHHTDVTHVERVSEAEAVLAKQAIDVVLLDLGLPDAHGLEAVRRARAAAPRVPAGVRQRHLRFAACDVCRRVFWEGSHWRRMRTVVDAMRAPPPAGEQHEA